MSRIFLFICFICLFNTAVFAQSVEQGQIFNKYSTEAEEGVNLFSGTSALNRKLVTLTSGNVSAAVELNYLGNVGEVVMNKNDIAPTSWVGLGWSLGHAKIVSDNSGTMWLGDDSYYLVTSSGVKYKILKSGKNSDDSDKWWIESLPYWTVEPNIKEVSFGSNKYKVIVGWRVYDDAGNQYDYGDGDYHSAEFQERNATEYTLANPHSVGIIGVVDNGKDELFPNAWNLKRIEDYDGNYLEYEYEQFVEKVRKRKYLPEYLRDPNDMLSTKIYHSMVYGENILTDHAYTKECYLKSIRSSQGESILFETKQKDYVNEFLDVKGNVEKDESNPDAYIDPIDRRYLSRIVVQKEISDKTGAKKLTTIKNIDFCYKPLNVEFYKQKKTSNNKAVDDNSEYVKRLLTAVVESSEKGEIQKEVYSYYESDFDEKTDLPLNLGALRSVKSNNCGTVKYIYEEQDLIKQNDKSGVHYDILPLTNIGMGNLDDGTVYVVGLNNKLKKVQVYHRINGSWKLIQNLNEDYEGKTNLATYYNEGQFIAGDKNWFVYVNDVSDCFMPYVWNGRFWENKKEIKKSGNAEFIEVGPGYILKARNTGDWITLTMPWNIWNGGSDAKFLDREADSDDDDRKHTAMFTSKNHFGIFFKDNSPYNSGHLKIWSFRPDKSVGGEAYKDFNLDDDNHYGFMDDNILVSGSEDSDWIGQFAKACHFFENEDKPDWHCVSIKELNGWQGYVDIMAMGEDYFVLRHNDNDDLSLFSYDGEKWSIPPGLDARNMVNQDYDPRTEAEWDAFGGYNFFVVRMPYIKRGWYNYIRPQRNYGVFYKEKKEWKWKDVYRASRLDEKRNNIYAGSNWYVAKERYQSSTYNGKEWNSENWTDFPFFNGIDQDRFSNIRSLNGDFLVAEIESNSWIIYKKRDSFTSGVIGFVLKEKIVEDPVTDKKITYSYDYDNEMPNGYPVYDYVTKSPLIKGIYINLPDNAGRIKKELCDEGGKLAGVAKGQICRESYYRNDVNGGAVPLYLVERKYERYRGKNESWPGFIYTDRLVEVSSVNRNIKTTEYYKYDVNDLNDMVKSVTVKDMNTGKNISESVNVYAIEIDDYSDLKKDHRLVEKAAVYQCVPDCKNGKVVSGYANKYKEIAGKMRLSEEWAYLPKNKIRDDKFKFDWSKTEFDSWKKTKSYSRYHLGIPTQTENQLGMKSSILFDNSEARKILASVKNAGINEILLMPGNTCDIMLMPSEGDASDKKIWDKCKSMPLVGRVIEKTDPNANDVDYGRFSDYAVYVSDDDELSGNVLKAKKAKYRFSAWVQSVDYSDDSKKLVLKLNGKESKSFPLKGSGQWEYIEWTDGKVFDKNAAIAVSLSSQDGSVIRLQDVRFVPEDAIVNVNFYDAIWNKPIASVNDHGVGSYFTYDYQGRVTQTYGENAKREVYLTSLNTFIPGRCKINKDEVSLKKLVVNGLKVPITEVPGTIEITVANNTDVLNVSWKTSEDGKSVNESVYYRMYENGVDPLPQYIKDDCCANAKQFSHDFIGQSMVLDIAISTTDSPYHVVINKSTAGWKDYGKNLGNGTGPVYWSGKDVSGLFYLKDDDLNRAYYKGSDWENLSEKQNTNVEYIASAMNNNSAYMFVLPDFMALDYDEDYFKIYGNNATGLFASVSSLQSSNEKKLVNQGNFEGSSTKSRLYRIASNKDNSESYVVYEKTVVTKTDEIAVDIRYPKGDSLNPVEKKRKVVKKDASLVVKKLENNKWIDFGTVLSSDVDDVSLAVGPRNIPYVAYIGKSTSKKKRKYVIDDPDGLYENADINDIPDSLMKPYDEEEYYVVVKHLEKEGGSKRWVGFSSADGDILQMNGQDLVGAKKVKLASDGTDMYMAILYDEVRQDSRYALKVFKLENVSNQLNFIEILDTFVNSSTIAYLEESDHFDMEVNGGAPYIAFENDDNDSYVSVLKFESSRWKSVGKPAFAKISRSKNSLDLAIDNDIPYVVFKESEESLNDKRQGKIVPMKYSKIDDVDLTISSIGNKDENVLFENFRQYILNYQYSVSENTERIVFDITFSNMNDVVAFSVINNDSNEFNWKKQSNWFSDALFDKSKDGNLSSVIVPLNDGKNKIQLQVWGKNGDILIYNFVICKDYTDGLAVAIKDANGNSSYPVFGSVDGVPVMNPSEMMNNSSSSVVVFPSNSTYGILPPENGSNTKSICIEHNSAWRMIVNGCIFSKNVCIDYDFVNRSFEVPEELCNNINGVFAASSSSSVSVSSSNSSQLTFIDRKGNKKVVDIVVIDDQKPTMLGYSSGIFEISSSSFTSSLSSSSNSQSCSSSAIFDDLSSSISENSSSSMISITSSSSLNENSSSSAMMYGSSSSDDIGISSSMISITSSSSLSENSSSSAMTYGSSSSDDIGISSSMISLTSSSSLDENGSSSSSLVFSSSSIIIDDRGSYGNVVHETAVPEAFASLIEYKLVGGEHISIANSVTMNDGKYIAGAIDVAASARIMGTLMSHGNVFVGSGAYVNTFFVGGTKEIQHGAVIANYIETTVDVPAVPVVSFSYGSTNVNVWPNKSAVLHPGYYEKINIYANASVTFEPGVYYVKSINVAPDASVDLKTDDDLIQIWVKDDFSIGDRSKFRSRGGSSKCFVYGNSAGYMYVGTNANVEAYVAYPNGYVNLAPNSKMSGAVWAKSIMVGVNAVVR